MSWARRFGVLLVAGLLLLLLSGCAGSDQSETGSAHSREWIDATIAAFLVDTHPNSCRVLITQRFAEQTTAQRGSNAVRSCEEEAQRPDGGAESVRIVKIAIHGSTAHAGVAITGGDLNGQVVGMRLLEEAGVWKIDQFTGLVKFDRNALVQAFAREYRERQESSTEGVGACVLGVLRHASTAKIDRYLFSGPADEIGPVYEECREMQVEKVAD